MSQAGHHGDRTVRVIGAFKIAKAIVLILLASGSLAALHHDVQAIAYDWIGSLRFDPENRYLAKGLARLGWVTEKDLKTISALTFGYAAIFLTEGVGLIMRKRWAEYLTVFATASLIPLEVFEAAKHCSPMKLLVLGVNVAIVWFLIWRLRTERRGQ
jgi:uncharacterized membrane protein (DUF2068 family)